jgi:rare lipoprotein A
MVRIMDRGPYITGRIIDLSKAAADRLRFTYSGITRVRIRVLSTPTDRQLARDIRPQINIASADKNPRVAALAGRRVNATQ